MSKSKAVASAGSPPLADPERSEGSRSEPERSGGSANGGRARGGIEDVEVLEKPRRRRFTAEQKLRILAEVDAARPGGIGAVLRREGLYSSHLITWRSQRDAGVLVGLQPRRRGPRPDPAKAEKQRIEHLEGEIERLRHRLKQAETIIEFQKKVHDILGIPLGEPPRNDATS
jgi:transposase